MTKEELLRFFELKIIKSTKYHLTVAVIVTALSWALLLFLLYYANSNSFEGGDSWGAKLMFAFLALGPVIGFAATVMDRNKKKPVNNKIYQTLVNNPDKIMWIYPSIHTYNGHPSYSIHFRDDAKNTFELDVSSKPEQETLVNGFATYCVYALIGFRPEWNPIYHKNPSTFKRDVIEYERNLKNQ